MKLKLVGFFKELNYGLEYSQSILNNIDNNVENKSKIVDYLQKGDIYIASPGIAQDVICKERGAIGSHGIVTDGVWTWPEELSYYVETYNITLPKEFINHMTNNKWIVPVLCEEELMNFDI